MFLRNEVAAFAGSYTNSGVDLKARMFDRERRNKRMDSLSIPVT